MGIQLVCEPMHEKINNLGFQPGMTQTRLYSHRSMLEAQNFGLKKKRNCTIHVAKTKVQISCALVSHRQIVGFLMRWLKFKNLTII